MKGKEKLTGEDTSAEDKHKLTDTEIASITTIDLSEASNKAQITFLKGIQYFTALTTLKASGLYTAAEEEGQATGITTLDVSNNSALGNYTRADNGDNTFSGLYLGTNTQLTSLNISGTAITVLNVLNNKELKTLTLPASGMTSLNVSGCSALVTDGALTLDLTAHANSLTTLNVSSMGVNGETGLLTKLNVSGLTALTDLDVSDNSGITTIDRTTTNAAAADDGTLYLGTSTKYTTLNLSATGITGALNLYDITDLKTLDVSNMSGTKLTSCPYHTKLRVSISAARDSQSEQRKAISIPPAIRISRTSM